MVQVKPRPQLNILDEYKPFPHQKILVPRDDMYLEHSFGYWETTPRSIYYSYDGLLLDGQWGLNNHLSYSFFISRDQKSWLDIDSNPANDHGKLYKKTKIKTIRSILKNNSIDVYKGIVNSYRYIVGWKEFYLFDIFSALVDISEKAY